jgi:hypothetical protein
VLSFIASEYGPFFAVKVYIPHIQNQFDGLLNRITAKCGPILYNSIRLLRSILGILSALGFLCLLFASCAHPIGPNSFFFGFLSFISFFLANFETASR